MAFLIAAGWYRLTGVKGASVAFRATRFWEATLARFSDWTVNMLHCLIHCKTFPKASAFFLYQKFRPLFSAQVGAESF